MTPDTPSLPSRAARITPQRTKSVPVTFGARPYRDREVMRPWTKGVRLPGWTPRVALEDGIRRMED